MKWLLLLALLANVLFFVAQTNKPAVNSLVVRSAEARSTGSIPSLSLLSELPSPAANKAKNGRCVIIGPFVEASQLEAVKTKLAAEGFPSFQIGKSLQQNTPFWTHIAPQTAPAKLIEMLDSLRKVNIDSYLLMYGEHMGAISLKYFTDSAGATEFIQQLARLGVVAEVIDLNAKNLNLWLEIPLQSGRFIPDWVNAGYSDKKTLKDNCDKVANSAQFH